MKLTPEDEIKINAGASLHRRYSNITFKVVKYEPDKLIVRTTQEKTHADNYADHKRLIDLTRELFDDFFDGALHVDAVPYSPAPPDIVTPEWISWQMQKHKVRTKDLVSDLGIEKSNISAIINGNRELSKFAKAAFYYFFLHRSSN